MKIEGDTIIFHDGTEEYANCGVIGLDKNLMTYGGYDDGFGSYCKLGEIGLSVDHAVELANHMIGLWAQYRELALSKISDEATKKDQ